MNNSNPPTENTVPPAGKPSKDGAAAGRKQPKAREIGGPKGLEPTRYGDWERKGRCVDF